MNYYIRERIGPKQSLTKENWLLCEDVPIARTGQMVYGPGEVPLPPGPDGIIIVDRYAEDVFRPETVASFNGKDVVDEHPSEDVNPENWRQLTVGVVLHPRRGIGADEDVMLADLMIKDPKAIIAVKDGKREVSCGYDADYVQAMSADGVTPMLGRGKQINILGNHVALVEAGRCGPRCAIGDSKSKELTMTWLDKLKAAFAGKDEAAFNAALAEAPKETAIHIHTSDAKKEDEEDKDEKDHKTMDAIAKDVKEIKDSMGALDSRVKKMEDAFGKEDEEEDEEEEKKKKTEDDENRKIEGSLEEEAPPGTSDGVAAKAKDSAYLADSFQEAVSLAEIIAPGIQVPTFDSKADPKSTFRSLCAFRRTVLDAASLQPETFAFITNTTGGKDYKKYTCDGLRTLFRAVGNYKKAENNRKNTADTGAPLRSGGGTGAVGNVTSIADINKRNQEFYAKQ